ncbi:MAG: polysaccharide deacetylase family protein [Bacteroidales bacterium]|nr:polysaccharide deacetylase family protein [Bacteroidales bacterium]
MLTNDVETTSIVNHRLCDKTGEKVLKEGMPALLELYERFNIRATFFFTGYIAEKFPEVVRMIIPFGHEVGSHGYSHKPDLAFDVLTYEEQVEHLLKSKKILEDISGTKVQSFRAPAARVNKDTPRALAKTGFVIDSSVASQRFDMFLSFGSKQKLNWLTAPRLPYFTNHNNLWKKGNSEILEIPISALLFPYIGTTLRIFPLITRFTGRVLYSETLINKKPIVFLTHPNEFINEEMEIKKVERRSQNFVSYILGDIIRHKLKLKNLGSGAIPIFEREIEFFYKKNFKFVTCTEYYNEFINLKS